MGPVVTHLPCDLNQQRKRAEARNEKVAWAVAQRSGKRSLLDRILRRTPEARELSADDLRRGTGEDVFHSFRF